MALIAVTGIGTAATGLTGLDAFGLSGGHAVMDMSHRSPPNDSDR